MFAVPRIQQLDGVVDQTVERFVVAGRANGDLAGDLAAAQHAGRGLGAVFLQPADVHVLQQWIGGTISRRGGTGAVEADHDPVQCLALNNRARQACLEVLKLCPGIEQLIGHSSIEVGLLATVGVVVQRADITRRTRGLAGVGAAGNG
ncbi:hypothetical protein D3C71_1735200 [compost metagenome]